jgi:hypothetical protein
VKTLEQETQERESERQREVEEQREQTLARQRRRDVLSLSNSAFRELEANVSSATHIDEYDFLSFFKWAQVVLRNWSSVDLIRAANVARKVLALPQDGADLQDPRLILTRTFLLDCLEQHRHMGGEGEKDEHLKERLQLLQDLYRATNGNPGPSNELRLGKALLDVGAREEAESVLAKLFHRGLNVPSAIPAGILLHQLAGEKYIKNDRVAELKEVYSKLQKRYNRN